MSDGSSSRFRALITTIRGGIEQRAYELMPLGAHPSSNDLALAKWTGVRCNARVVTANAEKGVQPAGMTTAGQRMHRC
jgi:hypothetical protein